jgi:WXG100 family type VII secretion target
MANSTLKVDYEEMVTKANDLKGQSSNMESILQDMLNYVNNLDTVWQSDAGSEYIGRFNFIRGEVQDAITSLNTHIDHLIQSAEIYSNAEKTANDKINSLSTANIF